MANENDNKLVNLADLKAAFDDIDNRKKDIQTAVSSPTASGEAVAFIDSITQGTDGVIAPTKKTVPEATQNAAGLMSVNDKRKLDFIEAGAEVNTVTGVKGFSEPLYRTGAVELTSANIGAVSKSGDTMTGDLRIEHSGSEAYVHVVHPNAASVYLDSYNEGTHGLWSPGYYNGNSFITSSQWLIRRNRDGKVVVADHYNKDEVNALGVLYTDVNIGNVTVNGSGYLYIGDKIPTGITPIAALIQNFGTTTGAITVTATGTFIMGAPNATVTNVIIRYYYRG